MARAVPNFTYQVESRNPRVIHVIDRRLLGQEGYAPDKVVDGMKFAGTVRNLVSAVVSSGWMTWVLLPASNELLNTDLNQTLSFDEKEITLRDALSQIVLTSQHRGGILWMAVTEPQPGAATHLRFCCPKRK